MRMEVFDRSKQCIDFLLCVWGKLAVNCNMRQSNRRTFKVKV